MSGDLPPGWAMTTVGTIADTQLGKTLSTSSKRERRLKPYLRNKNVQWHHIDVSDLKETYFSEAEEAKYQLRPGDLLVCEGGEVGRCAIWQLQVEGIHFQNALHRVRPFAGVSSNWLQYALRWSADTGRLAPHTSGVTISHLVQRALRQLEIPLAPSMEQDRVVAAIEEHFSRLDVVERSLVSAESKVVEFHVVHAKTAASGWPTASLGDIAQVFVGSTPSRKRPELWGGDIPWVSSGEIQFCRIGGTRETLASEAVRPDRIHPAGTVLLGMIGEGRTRGQAAVLEIAAAHNQNSAAIRTQRSKLSPDWLFYVFRAQYEANRRVGSGNNQPALNKTRVNQLPIPLPPLEAQYRLVAQLDEAVLVLDQVSAATQRARQRCASLRRAVLSEAFAGRLVAQDSNDESASVLLERIASSRQSEPKRRQKGKT